MTILEEGNPSDDTIRRWAYNEELFFFGVDEDLVLHRAKYFPLLIELSSDPACPKGGWILSVMDEYILGAIRQHKRPLSEKSRVQAVSSRFVGPIGTEPTTSDLIAMIDSAISEASKYETRELLAWVESLRKRIAFLTGIGAVDREVALQMGDVLMNGICRQLTISIFDQSPTLWVVRGGNGPAKPEIYDELLEIEKHTGKFTWARRFPRRISY